ncbi:hypothetical protein ACFLZ6_02115 [Nanoarchaeota archaeon]
MGRDYTLGQGECALYQATYAHDEQGNEIPRPKEPPLMTNLFEPARKQRDPLTKKELAWLNWEDVGRE